MNRNQPDILQTYHTQIKRLFIYYCAFSDKEDHAFLKIQNYQRLLSDLQFTNYQSIVPQLDVIFYSQARSKSLDLARFISTLRPIAQLVFSNLEKQKSIQKLLTVHIQALYDTILSQTDFGIILTQISVNELKQSSFIFLKKFQESLLLFYSIYFNKQGKEGFEQQFKMFNKLSRQLNFIPRIISKPVSYLIFSFLRQKSSKSIFHNLFSQSLAHNTKHFKFDFICFLQYLILLSYIIQKLETSDILKIYRLFQIIQVSPGCQSLAKKQKFKHLFLSNKQLEKFLTPKNQIQFSPQKSIINQVQKYESPIKKKLGDFYGNLKTKFAKLCLKTYVQTNFYLSSEVCKKLMKKICPSLTGISIDLMIKAASRLNFENFILLIDAAAKRIKLNPEILYQQILLYNTDKFSLNLIIQNVVVIKQQQTICNEVLSLVHSYLKSIYEYFQSNRTFNLQAYLKAMQEMAITPFIFQASEAIDIYKFSVKVQDSMTFQQFKESFKVIIKSIHFNFELQGAQRLIYLLQKMCQSKKGESLMKKNLLLIKQNPLYKLRLAFSQIYKSIQCKIKEFSQQVQK